MANIIACHVHDYFEIACMRRSHIVLTLHDGRVIKGTAIDLLTEDKNEFVCLKCNAGKANLEQVNLLDIDTLHISDSDSHIKVS